MTVSDLARHLEIRLRSLAHGTPLRLGILGGWAIIIAFAMSTQFLFQGFIWRNFDVSDIFAAWAGMLRDRMIVALCIAAALGLLSQWRIHNSALVVVLQATAIVIGALAGEFLLQSIAAQDDRQDPFSFAGRICRWTLTAGSIATIIYFWRTGSALTAAAENARVDEARLRRVAVSTQLETLTRQIEPHFLFNTLATIRRLQQTDRSRSQRLLDGLLDYMSATLTHEAQGRETLGDELRLVVAYLEVCGARMAAKLVIVNEVPLEFERMPFPPMVLATLAENVIKHGIDARIGGEVMISAERRGRMVAITIADTGVGFNGKAGGSGIGLANISEQLRLIYGPDAELRLTANTPHGVCATVLIADRAAA